MSMNFNRNIFKADFTLIGVLHSCLKMKTKMAISSLKISTATDRSAAQPNIVKENSADRHPVVQLISP
jgi:hypothetical protein